MDIQSHETIAAMDAHESAIRPFQHSLEFLRPQVTSREHKSKLRSVQKATDKLNKAVHIFSKSEKYFLDSAATYGDKATNLVSSDVSWYLERKEWCEEAAKKFTDMLNVALQELDVLHILKTREIETFQQQKAAQKTRRPFVFFC